MSNRHAGARLREYREALGLTQAQLAPLVGLDRAGTVSGWEKQGVVDFGALRLAADLCVNDREVYRWLRDGGPMPQFLRLLPGARPEAAWEGERRAIADRLRRMADELDPPTPAVADPAARAAQAAAGASPPPDGPGRPHRRASGA